MHNIQYYCFCRNIEFMRIYAKVLNVKIGLKLYY